MLPGFLDLTSGTEDKAKVKNWEVSYRPEAFCIPVTWMPKPQEDSEVLSHWLNPLYYLARKKKATSIKVAGQPLQQKTYFIWHGLSFIILDCNMTFHNQVRSIHIGSQFPIQTLAGYDR